MHTQQIEESRSVTEEKSSSKAKIQRTNDDNSIFELLALLRGLKIPFWRQSTGSTPVGGMEKPPEA